jgi:glycosyltransferase involved in cell wall biosynthesis
VTHGERTATAFDLQRNASLRRPAKSRMRILTFGSYRLWEQPRVRVLLDGLRERNHEVTECNVPLPFDTASRVRAARQPWRAPLLAFRIGEVWPRLWRKARTLPQPDAVLVPYLGHFDVHLARRLWPRTPIVLDHFLFLADTAIDRGTRSRAVLGSLDRIDRAAVRAADLVVVDTEGHRQLLPEPERADAAVVPVGAPREWFHEPLPRDGGPLRAIFFGIFTPLQGAPVIGEALRLLDPDPAVVRFTIVGRGQDFEATRRLAGSSPAVEWLDWIEYDKLPALTADHDICLGIFGANPKGLRVVPNKVYQGAAAGCAIVTSDSEWQRAALGEAAVFVPPGDSRALAGALRELVSDPARVMELRQVAYRRAVEAFTPAAVVRPLDERLAAGIPLKASAKRR